MTNPTSASCRDLPIGLDWAETKQPLYMVGIETHGSGRVMATIGLAEHVADYLHDQISAFLCSATPIRILVTADEAEFDRFMRPDHADPT